MENPLKYCPNRHTTSNPRRFDVNITISTNFHVISTYFFRCNFDSRKIYVVSMYFFRFNFSGRNIHVGFTYFFDVILMGKNSTSFFGKLQADENIRGGASNIKNLTFAKLLLHFSSKSPWCSPLLSKFESYNPHHCKNNCHKLFFLVFTEQLLYQIIFGRLDCYKLLL